MDTLTLLGTGSCQVALVGQCLGELDHPVAISAEPARLAERLLGLPGSFHLVVAAPGRLVAAGDAAGLRPVFTTRQGELPVVASHADILRRLTDAPVDRGWLAASLAAPGPPSVVVRSRSPFADIRPVPAGCLVRIEEGRCRIARWWRPPPATRSLREGGGALRRALTTAVDSRLAEAGGSVSVELSGGLDSSTLACLAAPGEPLLLTVAGRSPAGEDVRWARRVAGELAGASHRVVPAAAMPPVFAPPGDTVTADEPCTPVVAQARQQHLARLLAERGVVLDLNGQGGDEVLTAPLAYLGTALRAAPAGGWRHLRGQAALRGVPVRRLARAVLTAPSSFRGWLRDAAEALRAAPGPRTAAPTGWEAPPRLPPWATEEATSLLRAAMLGPAPTPAADDPALHAAVVRIRGAARAARAYRQAMETAGVATAMPFFDRTVIEACLAVQPWKRTDPWRVKPLLHEAFGGSIPQVALARRTKDHYNAEIHHGWRLHRQRLSARVAGSRLVALGLVDPDALRAALADVGRRPLRLGWLTATVAAERWLRSLAPPLDDPDPRSPDHPEEAHVTTIRTSHVSEAAARPRRLDRARR